jgi:hypothetical protein
MWGPFFVKNIEKIAYMKKAPTAKTSSNRAYPFFEVKN